MTYVFLADGFEEIEALSVVDILRRCQIEVQTVSITENRQVTGSHGISVVCDMKIDEITDYNDVEGIILPGGMPGTTNLYNCNDVHKAIDFCSQNKKLGNTDPKFFLSFHFFQI